MLTGLEPYVPRNGGVMPPQEGSEGGACVLLAGGRCVWDDLLAFDGSWAQTTHQEMPSPDRAYDVLAVNDVGMHVPGPVKHWYSNDIRWLPKWAAARRPRFAKMYPAPQLHSCNTGDTNIVRWPWPGHGTSTLNACYTALALGYESVVVCGAPLDESGHYFDPPWMETNFHKEVPGVRDTDPLPRHWTNAHRKVFQGRVKAMSGRTADLLGRP